MPKRKVVAYKREKSKTSWHTYGLQELHPEQFIRVVAGIIGGRVTLVPFVRAQEYPVFRETAIGMTHSGEI